MAFSLLAPLPKPSCFSSIRCCSSSSSSSTSSKSATTTTFDLQSYWSSLLTQINSHLDAALPVRYPDSINLAMRHSVLSPAAKRAAPVLCLATACSLFSHPLPSALPVAAALEMLHSASLVHDDLPSFDSSPFRRGLPSTHSLFGVDLAVLAADALFPLAFSHITASSTLPPPILLGIFTEMSRSVGSTGMVAGQFLDFIGDGDSNSNVMTVLEKKFGEMAEYSAVCGGLLGGATGEELERLRMYGRALGVLYQVVDDVMLEANGSGNGKMRSNASVVKVLGMDKAMEVVGELRQKAKGELTGFRKRYGEERVMPLFSFVDYAVERGFVVDGGVVAA